MLYCDRAPFTCPVTMYSSRGPHTPAVTLLSLTATLLNKFKQYFTIFHVHQACFNVFLNTWLVTHSPWRHKDKFHTCCSLLRLWRTSSIVPSGRRSMFWQQTAYGTWSILCLSHSPIVWHCCLPHLSVQGSSHLTRGHKSKKTTTPPYKWQH